MKHDYVHPNKIYNKEILIGILKKYRKEFGKNPTIHAINKNPDYPSANSFVYYFGSWKNALEEAELIYSKNVYSDEELLDIIINFEGNPTQKKFKKGNYPSPSTYAIRFGSWSNALILAKKRELELNKNKTKKNSELRSKFNNSPIKYDKITLIQTLQTYYEIEGKKPTQAGLLLKKDIYPSPSTFAYNFGSWGKALEAAKFKSIRHNYSEDELIELLKNFDGKPTMKLINKHTDFPNSCTYINRFGSWNNAMKLAGYEPRKYTK